MKQINMDCWQTSMIKSDMVMSAFFVTIFHWLYNLIGYKQLCIGSGFYDSIQNSQLKTSLAVLSSPEDPLSFTIQIT